ncbi:MAG: sugar ABC transporter ATP-binding protein [Synergistaceae bacterium]|nr:sugar ABC transporter ATP-binding protein [Synergistaceae bacterium]
MLEIKHVNKTYGAVAALRGVSLSLAVGEITALLGANGSGKSTLVKILGGSVKEDSGEIYIGGKRVHINGSGSARANRISAAYQELSLIPRMTVIENIMLGHYVKNKFGRIDIQKNRECAASIFAELGVECDLDAYPQDLAPSARSIVEIVKAVSWNPGVLLLDEVTAALHHDEAERLFAFMRTLAGRGVSIVMVTHRLGEIYQVAGRAVILRNGEVAADTPLESCDIETVVYHMTGKIPETHKREAGGAARDDAVLEIKGMAVGDAVKDVSMTVNRGEIIGVGGLEGQGQSQFIRAVYGVERQTAGEMKIKGSPVRIHDASDAVRRGIGFVSGDRNRESIFPIMSIRENLYSAKMSYGGMFGFISEGRMRSSAQKIVDDYGIKIGRVTDPISSLSGGNQQKVVFGRWILVTPDILLLDDPTKGVDVAARRELHNFLKDAADKGMTVIISSSDNDELLEISERIYVFYEGKIYGVLAGDDKTEEKLISAMMGL